MAKKFDFASPGVEINEIDMSQVPAQTVDDGILLVGTSLKGPAMVPVKVRDLDSFIEIFGAPQSGKAASSTDVWRDGNRYGPNYASYAAQAHLASKTSPVTFIRLLGQDAAGATGTKAGWNLGGGVSDATGGGSTLAYGLFVMPSASVEANAAGTLAAVIYTTGSSLTLRGTVADTVAETTSSLSQLIKSQNSGQPGTFKLDIWSDSTNYETKTFHLVSTNNSGFIRNVLNTNPQKLNSNNFSSTESYFVGETYEEEVRSVYANAGSSSAGQQYGILLPLVSGSQHWVDHTKAACASQSGWILSRDADPKNAAATWASSDLTKLFRVVSLHEGEWMQQNYAIKIHQLKLGTTTTPKSTFALSVVNSAGESIENFYNLNLDESSEDFILKKIGDETRTWDATNKVFNVTGDYPNQSNYIRIVMSDAWKSGLSDDYALPFGFQGPTRVKGFSLGYGSVGAQIHGDVINDGVRSTATVTYSTGAMAADDTLIFTHPKLGNLTITFKSGGSTSTTFDKSSGTGAHIDRDTVTTTTATATAVAAILNSLDDYDASSGGTSVVTITAVSTGTYWTFALPSNTDAGGRQAESAVTAGTDTDDGAHPWVKGNYYAFGSAGETNLFADLPVNMSASFTFPTLKTTTNGTKMGSNYNQTDVLGVRQVYGSTAVSNKTVYDSADFADFLDAGSSGGSNNYDAGNATELSLIFTLDEVVKDSNGLWYWNSGSLADGTSYTALQGTSKYLKDAPKQFHVPLFGGADGVDITLVDPFSSEIALAGGSVLSHYAYHTVDKAIEIASDPESIKYDVVAIPGMTNSGLQNKLIRKVEERGDALAIIDINDDYKEAHENSGTRTGGDVATAITNMQARDLNTSYAATYFPRIKLRDTLSGNDEVIIAPPSVAGIGAIAFSEANSDGPWFAPAGFNRGGIGVLGGNGGPRVVGTWKTLSKQNRDELYQENINPIARFPAVQEIVIFGQKTLQQTPSALDRINVRRLMIFLKKKVGAIADTILFDQNVQNTWNRFLAQADPLLASVKARLGISDYKLVLDETTTTDDLVDRNILYAKVFVKPTKAIEYIVIDFVVTRTGVEF
jgi:hypothetical protein